jgi:transposase
LGSVVEAVRPHRFDGRGESWRLLVAHHDQIKGWLDAGLTAVKVGELLARRGVVVPERTLHRYAKEECGHGRGRESTVRVADGEPGDELHVDFGRMGLIFDAETGRDRVCHALIFTACYSRHCFVWLTFSQTTEAVISGFEAAWSFYGGVFKTAIPDNMKAIVTRADGIDPRLNQAFVEYAQARGFAVDPARGAEASGQAEGGENRGVGAQLVLRR